MSQYKQNSPKPASTTVEFKPTVPAELDRQVRTLYTLVETQRRKIARLESTVTQLEQLVRSQRS